jgi:hypothetical protein
MKQAHVIYTTIGILCILIVLVAVLQYKKEEFMGSLPVSNQSSYIPKDSPGPMSANPTMEKPTIKDIIDARHAVQLFLAASKSAPKNDTKTPLTELATANAPIFLKQLDMLEQRPEEIGLSTNDVRRQTALYKNAATSARQVPEVEGFASAGNTSVETLRTAVYLFMSAYKTADVSKLKSSDTFFISDLDMNTERTLEDLDKNALSSLEILSMTGQYQRGIQLLSALPLKPTPQTPQTSNAATTQQNNSGTPNKDMGSLTLQDLLSLIRNIDEEVLRLKNLQSREPTTLTRINNLEEIVGELRNYYKKIQDKTMQLSNVPITADEARAFLQNIRSDVVLSGIKKDQTVSPSAPSENITDSSESVLPFGSMNTVANVGTVANAIPADLYKLLQNIKWSMELKVQSSPELAHREYIMKRLESLEQQIAAYAYKGATIPPELQYAFRQQISALSGALNDRTGTPRSTNTASGGSAGSAGKSSNNTSTAPWDTRVVSASDRTPSDNATYNVFTNSGTGLNADAMIRPGFMMNDERIQRRASSSAWDDSVVGGLDYKTRTLDLCRQIQSSQLGDPANFGCIENPNAVSSTYSWKGAHDMVCNRLGDTWGAWYPEMFGCGKYDPTSRYKGNML